MKNNFTRLFPRDEIKRPRRKNVFAAGRHRENVSEAFRKRKKFAVRQSEASRRQNSKTKLHPKTAVSSGSEQQKNVKALEKRSNWKIWIAEINFYFAIPWDIRRRNFSAAFVRLAKIEQILKFHVQQLFCVSCFPILSLAFITAFFGLLWLIPPSHL